MVKLIELYKAGLSQRNTARHYLDVIVNKCGSSQHYRVISNPHYTAAVDIIANPPGESDITRLSERLDISVAFQLLLYRKSTIPTVTGKGIILSRMIEVTHIEPKLLLHALKQEKAHDADDTPTLDLRAWTHLPKIIRDNWRRFNHTLQAHIMSCMAQHLQKQLDSPAYLNYSSTLFTSTASNDHLPSIPVRLPSHELRDLMEVLISASIDRLQFNQLLPASKTIGLSNRSSDHDPLASFRVC